MAQSLAVLTALVVAELGVSADDEVAAVPSGTGTDGETSTSDTRIAQLLNDGKDEVYRTAFLQRKNGTLAAAIGDGPTIPLSTLTASGVKVIRRAEEVYWTPTAGSKARVRFVAPNVLYNQFPDRSIAGNGTVAYWSTVIGDPSVIEVYQKPATTGAYSVDGYSIPLDMVGGGSPVGSPLPDEYNRVLVAYACAKVCRQRLDDSQLEERGISFAMEYDEIRLRMREAYPPAVRAEYFDNGPDGQMVPMAPPQPKRR